MYFSHKTQRRIAALIAFLALLTAGLPHVGDTWAWFSATSSSGVSAMQAATFAVSITLTDSQGAAIVPTEGQYTLDAGTYHLSLTPTGSASQGYCLLEFETGFTGYTEPITLTDQEFTIDLVLSQGDILQITADWGVYDPGSAGFSLPALQPIPRGDTLYPTGVPQETLPAEPQLEETLPDEAEPEEPAPGETQPEEEIA